MVRIFSFSHLVPNCLEKYGTKWIQLEVQYQTTCFFMVRNELPCRVGTISGYFLAAIPEYNSSPALLPGSYRISFNNWKQWGSNP